MINQDESDKTCYGDHFKCNECTLVKSGFKHACKKQCEYSWEHRNDPIHRHNNRSYDDGYDIPGQYATSYDAKQLKRKYNIITKGKTANERFMDLQPIGKMFSL